MFIDFTAGCLVKEKIKVSAVRYDSVDFMSYILSSSPDHTKAISPTPVICDHNTSSEHGEQVFKTILYCSDSATSSYDTITVNQNNVVFERTRDAGESSCRKYERPVGGRDGWEEFSLEVREMYQLLDGQGKSWLPPNISTDCPIGDVELQGSQFMRHCHTRTPTWHISTTKQEIYLPYNDGNGPTQHSVSLYSKKDFKPIFWMNEKKIVLGWKNNSMTAETTNDTVKPLPCFNWFRLVILLTEDHPTMKLKVR